MNTNVILNLHYMLTCLVVENDNSLILMIEKTIKDNLPFLYNVGAVKNLCDAKYYLEDNPNINIVILDINLDGENKNKDGLEVLKFIIKKKLSAKVLMLSEDYKENIILGNDMKLGSKQDIDLFYMPKPFIPSTLISQLYFINDRILNTQNIHIFVELEKNVSTKILIKDIILIGNHKTNQSEILYVDKNGEIKNSIINKQFSTIKSYFMYPMIEQVRSATYVNLIRIIEIIRKNGSVMIAIPTVGNEVKKIELSTRNKEIYNRFLAITHIKKKSC